MAKTSIEWADKVWNPVTGCTKISIGCKNCYAEKMTKRLKGMGQANYQAGFGTVVCHDHMLDKPLHWKKPQRIFVNSMSDLFHKDVPFWFVDKVFAVMALCPQHTFIVLTKRADRMHEYMTHLEHPTSSSLRAEQSVGFNVKHAPSWISLPSGRSFDRFLKCWPLPNVQLGVSVEDEPTMVERVRFLHRTPAAKRIISYEPAIGPADFMYPKTLYPDGPPKCCSGRDCACQGMPIDPPLLYGINQIIMGGESGGGYRPMDLQWARDVRDQCKAAGVAFYFKQTAGKNEIPDDLKIREYPNA